MAASRSNGKRKVVATKDAPRKSSKSAAKSGKARSGPAAKASTKSAKQKPSGKAKAGRATKAAANRTVARKPSESTGPQAVLLPERLDSSMAAGVLAELKAHRGKAIVVDGSQVRRVGAQPLQILVSAARTWQSDGNDYRLLNPSSELLEAASILGLPASELAISGQS